jgi:hypothetical protein
MCWSVAALATGRCLSVSLLVHDFSDQSQDASYDVANDNFARLC